MSSKTVTRIEVTEPIKRNIDDSSAIDATREASDVAQYESGTGHTFDAGLTSNVVNLGKSEFILKINHYSLFTTHSLLLTCISRDT